MALHNEKTKQKDTKRMTSIKARKCSMYAVFYCVFLLGGIEYAVILPTLWLYLHDSYNAAEYMLGVVLSIYSLAAFFSSPIFGRICDKTGRSKRIIISCGCFQVVGSFLYSVGISQWLCVASRFICGIGAAGEAVALAEVARYTTEKERTGIISKLIAAKQLALLGAPGLNVVLRLIHFQIGPFEVNKYTIPGAFMAVLWLLLIAFTVFFYSEPFYIYEEEKKQKDLVSNVLSSNNQPCEVSGGLYDAVKQQQDQIIGVPEEGCENSGVCSSDPNEVLQESQASREEDTGNSGSLIDDDKAHCLPDASDGRLASNNSQNSVNDDYAEKDILCSDDVIAKEGVLGFICKEYIKDNVIAILTLLFCAMFSQISLEAMCTQVSLEYMDFGEFENSILYCLCGAEILIIYFLVVVLSNHVADRIMILCGGFLLLASDLWLLIYLPLAPKHDRSKNLLPLSLAIAMDVLSLPFLLVCATSLYSKMTRRETQGLSQGLRYAIVGLGTILAPMWASSVVSKPYLVLGVLVGIQLLALLLCLASFKRLKGLETETDKTLPQTSKPADNLSLSKSNKIENLTPDAPLETTSVSKPAQYGSVDNTDPSTYRYSVLKSDENV